MRGRRNTFESAHEEPGLNYADEAAASVSAHARGDVDDALGLQSAREEHVGAPRETFVLSTTRLAFSG